jgi:enoyl-CoA hydratase/carnithine racemase
MLIYLLNACAVLFFPRLTLIHKFAPAAGTQRLPRLVGLPKALEMMLVWLTCALQVAMHTHFFSSFRWLC